ncbi:MAG: hypothetical protein H0V53_11845 [Rubrobacter sp.]|nr:hypothetical protein [Rubrobacter sp.]
MKTTERMTDRGRITGALDRMHEETGVVWRGGGWTCCGTCGHYELTTELGEGASFVFWHAQSDERAFGEEVRETITYTGYDEESGEEEEYDEEEFFTEVGDDLLSDLFIYHSDTVAASETVDALRRAGYEVEWDGSPREAIRVAASG